MSALAVASSKPIAAARPRLIDPRGHRFGAALSAVILVVAFAIQAPIFVAAIGLALGVSALFGTQYSALGRPWPFVRRALQLGPPAELEGEYPPRFAQALGTVGLLLAVGLFAVGAGAIAWLPVAGVAGLQTVLAATGYCLGCRLYFLRWYVPSLFDRLVAAVPRLAR
jgi:hypothetical protein